MIDSVVVEHSRIGRVLSLNDEGFVVELYDDESESKKSFAKKSFDCMIEPMIADKVFVVGVGSELYITNVLERKETTQTVVKLQGKLLLECGEVEFRVGKVESFIGSLKHFLDSFALNAKSIELFGGVFRSSGGSKESSFVSSVERCDKSYKYVNEHEEVQCKSSRHISKESRVVRSKNLIATAENQVKIDGENIHLA